MTVLRRPLGMRQYRPHGLKGKIAKPLTKRFREGNMKVGYRCDSLDEDIRLTRRLAVRT